MQKHFQLITIMKKKIKISSLTCPELLLWEKAWYRGKQCKKSPLGFRA